MRDSVDHGVAISFGYLNSYVKYDNVFYPKPIVSLGIVLMRHPYFLKYKFLKKVAYGARIPVDGDIINCSNDSQFLKMIIRIIQRS